MSGKREDFRSTTVVGDLGAMTFLSGGQSFGSEDCGGKRG